MCCASACMRVRHPVPECTPDDGPVHWRVAVQVASGRGCARRSSGVQTDVPSHSLGTDEKTAPSRQTEV